jgi:hypothetical protein
MSTQVKSIATVVDINEMTMDESSAYLDCLREMLKLTEEMQYRIKSQSKFGGVFWRAVRIANILSKYMHLTEPDDHVDFILRTHKLEHTDKSSISITDKAEKSIKELILKKGGAERFFETEDALSDFLIPTEQQIESFKKGYFDACAIASSFEDDHLEAIEAFKALIGNIYMILDEPTIDDAIKLEKIVFAVYAQRVNIESLEGAES